MKSTTWQRWCAWSIVAFVAIYLFAFIGLAGYVPPHPPSMTGLELQAFYDGNRIGIKAGQLICMITACLILVWSAPVSAQMARIEQDRLPMLSIVQCVAAGILVVFFMVCSMLWTIAAYREDISPELLRMLNDSGWLVFVMVFPEYVVQLGCIAIVGLADKRAQPFLPRWACFFTLWVAVAGMGGGMATFFKAGPFAWNGLLGFWVPVGMFLVWLGVLFYYLLRAIKQQEMEEAARV